MASDGYISKRSVPSSSNLHFKFLTFGHSFFHSALSASDRVPECRKLKMYVRPGWPSVISALQRVSVSRLLTLSVAMSALKQFPVVHLRLYRTDEVTMWYCPTYVIWGSCKHSSFAGVIIVVSSADYNCAFRLRALVLLCRRRRQRWH